MIKYILLAFILMGCEHTEECPKCPECPEIEDTPEVECDDNSNCRVCFKVDLT